MSFDAHSLERLAALGRTLPSKLPQPSPPATAEPPPRAQERRHRVETEQDPGRLFHELMDASHDGSVPAHLMERLRGLERPPAAAAAGSGAGAPTGSTAAAAPGRPARAQGRGGGRSPRPVDPHDDLYTAFSQLLLEEDDD